jgi:hypothetical protein
LVVQSENWLASGWRSDATANVTTVSATTGTLDPYGTNTANAISPTSGNTSHLKVGSDGAITFTSGTVYTSSAFFKRGTGNAGRYIQIAWPATRFAANTFANFDLELGTVALVTGSTVTAGIENYGNGWYRCRCTNTCISSATGNGISIALIETSGATRLPTFTGTTTDVLYGWGAQTETGSIATSYIPTTTALATRNAEVITLSGVVSGCIGQTEGTIYAEVDIKQLPALNARTFIDVGSSGNRVFLGFTSLASNTLRLQIDAGVGGSACVDIRTVVANAGIIKVAVAYQSLNCALYVNGVQATNIQSNFAFSFTTALSALFLGSTVSASAFLNDRIRAAALYTSRLTNDQLQALTT